MFDIVRREAVYLWYYISVQLGQILPYWVLGMALGSAVSVFGKQRLCGWFARLQGGRARVLGLPLACLLGLASPLCLYGSIPLAAAFSEKGMPQDLLAAFLMSSILLNPQLLLYTAALGQGYMWLRLAFCFLCGLLAGVLVRLCYRNKLFFQFSEFLPEKPRDTAHNPALRYLFSFGRNLRATGGYFLLGILLAALFQRYVPAEVVAGLFSENEGFGVLLAAGLGIPLYACGGGTVPLLAQWLGMGMSPGAAMAFMLSGPASKITNLGALKIALGGGRFMLYLCYVLVFSLLAGWAVNSLWALWS